MTSGRSVQEGFSVPVKTGPVTVGPEPASAATAAYRQSVKRAAEGRVLSRSTTSQCCCCCCCWSRTVDPVSSRSRRRSDDLSGELPHTCTRPSRLGRERYGSRALFFFHCGCNWSHMSNVWLSSVLERHSGCWKPKYTTKQFAKRKSSIHYLYYSGLINIYKI